MSELSLREKIARIVEGAIANSLTTDFADARDTATSAILALPQLASVGRDSSSQSQPVSGSVPSPAREAEPSAAWRPTHVHADGGKYRLIRYANGRSGQHEPWLAGVIYEGADGRLWWTGNDRWFDRFTALPLPNTPLSAGKDG